MSGCRLSFVSMRSRMLLLFAVAGILLCAVSTWLAPVQAEEQTDSKTATLTQEPADCVSNVQIAADEQGKKNRKRSKQVPENLNAPGFVDLAKLAPPQKGTLRLGCWNMHDVFDTIDDPNNDVVLTPKEYEAKLNNLAKVFRGLNAQIMGVEEVENAKTLKDLAQRAGYKYSLLVEGNDHGRGIDVGVLSQVPIKNYVSHIRDRYPASNGSRNYMFSRDCLEVHFDHPSKITMLVNHFKSKRGGDDSTKEHRMAQANLVKSIVSKLNKYPVIVVGDLNDEPDSQALAPVVKQAGLYDALSWIGSNRVTFKNKRYSSALDYLLLNQMLKPKMLPKTARIVVGSAVKAASDHRPVIVDVAP